MQKPVQECQCIGYTGIPAFVKQLLILHVVSLIRTLRFSTTVPYQSSVGYHWNFGTLWLNPLLFSGYDHYWNHSESKPFGRTFIYERRKTVLKCGTSIYKRTYLNLYTYITIYIYIYSYLFIILNVYIIYIYTYIRRFQKNNFIKCLNLGGRGNKRFHTHTHTHTRKCHCVKIAILTDSIKMLYIYIL